MSQKSRSNKDLHQTHDIWNFIFQEIGEEFVEFLEKELNVVDPSDGYNTPQGGNPSKVSGAETSNNNTQGEASKGNKSVQDNLDEIEATLAQLKKELGL